MVKNFAFGEENFCCSWFLSHIHFQSVQFVSVVQMKRQREWLEGLKWRHSFGGGRLISWSSGCKSVFVSPGCYWLMTSQGERGYWLMLLSREEEREERMDLHFKFCTRARNMFSWQSKGLFCCPGSKEQQSVGQKRMREKIFPGFQSASWSVCRQTVFFAKSFWRPIHRHLQTSRLSHHHFWVESLVCPMFVVCFSIYSFFKEFERNIWEDNKEKQKVRKSEVLKTKTPSSSLTHSCLLPLPLGFLFSFSQKREEGTKVIGPWDQTTHRGWKRRQKEEEVRKEKKEKSFSPRILFSGLVFTTFMEKNPK